MSLGEKLRSLRQKSKRTLREQGTHFGVSMNSIYRWEHDIAIPRQAVLKKIAEYYNVPIEWLISENASASLVSEDELDLLGMFRALPDTSRFKIIGYVERMCMEEPRIEEYIF